MQNENPTMLSSDRPAQQSISDTSSRVKLGTHQHHHEDDPLVGGFMGLRVEEPQVQEEQSDVSGQEIKVEDASKGGDVSQSGQEPEAEIDRSSIFDRDASKDESQDLSRGIGMASGFGGYCDVGRRHRNVDIQQQSSDLGQDFSQGKQDVSSDIGQQQNASQDWFQPSDIGKSTDIDQQQQFSSSGFGQSSDLGQQQDVSQDWKADFDKPSNFDRSSDFGKSSDLTQPQNANQDWRADFGEEGFSGSGFGQSSGIGQDRAQSDVDAGGLQSRGLSADQSSTEMRGVDRDQWPQNQGVWNPSLQGDSSSADKGISSQFDASGGLSDQSQSVSEDKGPYAMDIQDQQRGSYGSEGQPLLGGHSHNFGSKDAGDISYGSTTTDVVGENRGLYNAGSSSSEGWQSGSDVSGGAGNTRDLGSAGQASKDASGFADADVPSQPNVHDFGRGDLSEQSKLSGDKSTFSQDAEEDWGKKSQKQFVGEGGDRVHGLAQEDFI